MIDVSEMMQRIIDTCPKFARTYESFVAEWQDEPETPYYLLLADFSRYLINLLEGGKRKELSAAFRLIELLHTDGDKYVREAATIGILENLQNTNLHSTTTPNQFIEFLLPTSVKYWQKVEEFWINGTIITDD